MTSIWFSIRRLARHSAIVLVPAMVLTASAASGQSLGTAQNFAVLGATTVTSTGATVVTGQLGVLDGHLLLFANQIAFGSQTITIDRSEKSEPK